MGAKQQRVIKSSALLFAALISVGVTMAAAVADPASGESAPTNQTLGLRELGFNPTLSFYGLQGVETVNLPVPPGLAPTALTATVELPMGLRVGSIAVIQDDRTISRVEVPPTDLASIRLPLAGAEVRDNSVTLMIRTNLIPPAGYCIADSSNPLRLNDSAVEFAGTAQLPTTVADFLPPVLRRLTLFVPSKPTRTESDAAVRMTAAIVLHYGDQPTAITVSPLDGDQPPPSAQPFERQLVIREGPAPAVALQGAGVPALLITGSAGDLINQTRLLAGGDLTRLALSSKAVVGPLKDSPQLPADVTTLRELGIPGQNATSLVDPQVNLGLDQTRLGRAAHALRVHLLGSYTPLPSNLNGQVVVSINGETIERWPAAADGTIDRWVDVPDRLLQRYTNLAVAVDAAGNTGGCGESQPITLTIDGDSTVTSAASDPPIPAGFQSIPQAFMPRVKVGIGDDDVLADTARAAKIVAGMQRLSALPIDISVVSLQDAIGSPDPAVLIAARGWTDDRVGLPVDASNDTIRLDAQDGTGQTSSLTLDPRLRFGSLQTVRAGHRTVLVATSNDASAQLDGLLDWLSADPQRWQRLKGAAIIAAPGREPVMVAADAVPTPKPLLESGDSTPYWLLGAGVLAVVLVGSGVIYLRTRNEPGN
jgi:hypothetical protein